MAGLFMANVQKYGQSITGVSGSVYKVNFWQLNAHENVQVCHFLEVPVIFANICYRAGFDPFRSATS